MRWPWFWLVWTPLLACFIPAGSAQSPSLLDPKQPRKLEWKFKDKDRFVVDTQMNLTQIRKPLGGLEQRDVVSVASTSSFQVIKVEEDGTVLFEQKIDSIRYRYDGTEKISAAATADLIGKLQGAVFRITLGPDRTVKKIEGYDEHLKKIAQTNPPDVVDRFKTQVQEADLKAACEEGFAFLPEEPLKVGDEWSRKIKMSFAPFGKLETTLQYTVKSIKDNRVTITVSHKGSDFTSQVAGMIPKSDFTLDTRSGTMVFDAQNGRLLSSDLTIKFHGRVDIPNVSLPGTQTEMAYSQLQTIKITVRDRSSAR